MRHLTDFKFYYNTPLVDFQNTIHFSSNSERNEFFNTTYEKLEFENVPFNFVRDRSTIRISAEYGKFQGINYCSFVSDFEPDTVFYAYVIGYSYINDNVTELQLLIDGIMTYTQGDVLLHLTNLDIERQHLGNVQYDENIYRLKNNTDVLKTFSKSYFYTDGVYFKDFYAVILSSADLSASFGTVDNPKIKTSSGGTFDSISSPLNIYAIDQIHFKQFMEAISNYPWIAQNIKEVMLIPKDFIGELFLEDVPGSPLKKFADGGFSYTVHAEEKLQEIELEPSELYELYELDPVQDRHLLRSEYATCEFYTFDGQSLTLDLGKLNEQTGLKFGVEGIIGYENEITFYIKDYNTEDKQVQIFRPDGTLANFNPDRAGSYLNESITFKHFDTLPVLVDTAKLGRAKTANQRKYAESNLISNQLGRIVSPDNTLEDRFYAGASILSNFAPEQLFGKFNDEYDYYRQMKAETADLALETPAITEQTNSNSFQIKNEIFGITMMLSKPNSAELRNIKRYYGGFGFEWNSRNDNLKMIDSMSIANYVKFSGSWFIENADVAINQMMNAQFENGVRLWHNNGMPNPMIQNLEHNKRIK